MLLSGIEYFYNDYTEILYFQTLLPGCPLHNHPTSYQIIMPLEGNLAVDFLDCNVVLRKDEFLVIPPYRTHITRAVVPVRALCINISKYALTLDSACVLNLVDEVVMLLFKKGLVEKGHLANLSRAIFQLLYHCRKPDECSDFVAKALSLLEESPHQNISVAEMGTIVSKCKDHLSREFKKSVGLTMHSFQMQNRTQAAAWLLVNTQKTVELVTRECGFYDSSHFARHFKRQFGLSPSAFRDIFRKATKLIIS